jgi:hypothetical protein
MNEKDLYATYAAALTLSQGVVFYCFNANIVDVQDFIMSELEAQNIAVKKHYKLFKIYKTFEIGSTSVCLN